MLEQRDDSLGPYDPPLISRMHLPAPYSVILLAYLFVLLPWGVWKSKRRFDTLRANRNAARAAGRAIPSDMPSPANIYVSTLFNMGLLFALSFLAAREVGVNLFRVDRFGAREFIACVVWFVVSFGVGLVSRAWRSAKELREMPMMDLVPRTPRDWIAFVAVAIAAGVCEEAAYRGMGYQALTWWIGGSSTLAPFAAALAAVLSATAFALAHAVQGNKSMVLVFVKALLFHALVWYTGTLVGAMVGHALIDLVTAYRSLGLAKRLEQNAVSS